MTTLSNGPPEYTAAESRSRFFLCIKCDPKGYLNQTIVYNNIYITVINDVYVNLYN